MDASKILRLAARRAQAAENYGRALGEIRNGEFKPGVLDRLQCAQRWEWRWADALREALNNG